MITGRSMVVVNLFLGGGPGCIRMSGGFSLSGVCSTSIFVTSTVSIVILWELCIIMVNMNVVLFILIILSRQGQYALTRPTFSINLFNPVIVIERQNSNFDPHCHWWRFSFFGRILLKFSFPISSFPSCKRCTSWPWWFTSVCLSWLSIFSSFIFRAMSVSLLSNSHIHVPQAIIWGMLMLTMSSFMAISEFGLGGSQRQGIAYRISYGSCLLLELNLAIFVFPGKKSNFYLYVQPCMLWAHVISLGETSGQTSTWLPPYPEWEEKDHKNNRKLLILSHTSTNTRMGGYDCCCSRHFVYRHGQRRLPSPEQLPQHLRFCLQVTNLYPSFPSWPPQVFTQRFLATLISAASSFCRRHAFWVLVSACFLELCLERCNSVYHNKVTWFVILTKHVCSNFEEKQCHHIGNINLLINTLTWPQLPLLVDRTQLAPHVQAIFQSSLQSFFHFIHSIYKTGLRNVIIGYS